MVSGSRRGKGGANGYLVPSMCPQGSRQVCQALIQSFRLKSLLILQKKKPTHTLSDFFSVTETSSVSLRPTEVTDRAIWGSRSRPQSPGPSRPYGIRFPGPSRRRTKLFPVPRRGYEQESLPAQQLADATPQGRPLPQTPLGLLGRGNTAPLATAAQGSQRAEKSRGKN